MDKKSEAGKGDTPRPCDVKRYVSNYDSINWAKDDRKIEKGQNKSFR